MRVSCPPHRFACHYGIDFPDPEKLIANQMSMAKICEYLNVDSLGYLSIEGMIKATGRPANSFCLACFNGDYPLPVDPALGKSSWKNASSARARWRRKKVSRPCSRS